MGVKKSNPSRAGYYTPKLTPPLKQFYRLLWQKYSSGTQSPFMEIPPPKKIFGETL